MEVDQSIGRIGVFPQRFPGRGVENLDPVLAGPVATAYVADAASQHEPLPGVVSADPFRDHAFLFPVPIIQFDGLGIVLQVDFPPPFQLFILIPFEDPSLDQDGPLALLRSRKSQARRGMLGDRTYAYIETLLIRLLANSIGELD